MFERAPNGFFVRNLIVFNLLRRGGYVAKGFVFEAPDLTNSQVADLNDFQDQLCLLLASLHENQRLQVQYFCDSDYKGELLRYQQETEKFSNVWTKRARNERFSRYWQAMSERKLRGERVIFYISRSLENVPKAFQSTAARRDYYNTLLDQLETEFEHVHRLLLEIFGSGGARILPMTDLDHFRHYKWFLNPSLNDRFDYDPADGFASELSIQENCWHSEGSGQSDFGFFLDGHAPEVSPIKLLALLDKAKAFPLLKAQQPESVANVDFTTYDGKPLVSDFNDYEIQIEETFRFNTEDTLVFRLVITNKIDAPLIYQPDSFTLRAGNRLYPQSISAADGTVPPKGQSIVYFAVTGTPDGGRNELSLKNAFTVLVTRLSPTPPVPPVVTVTNAPVHPIRSPKGQP